MTTTSRLQGGATGGALAGSHPGSISDADATRLTVSVWAMGHRVVKP